MKVLFIRLSPYLLIKNPHPQDVSPHPDIGYSSAILEKEGHEVYLIDTEAEKYSFKKILFEIDKINPEVIFILTKTPTAKLTIKIAKKIKSKFKTSIFLFGQHASSIPESFLFQGSPIDLCVIGEPEITIKELLENFGQDSIFSVNGIAYYDRELKFTKPRELIQNLDSLPLPKHNFFLNEKYKVYYPINFLGRIKWGFMESSRGCPYDCIFCSPTLRLSYGKTYRALPPKKVVDEIEYLISKGVNVVEFMDDIFTFDQERIVKICEEINRRGIKIKWTAQTRPDLVSKPLLKKMKLAGCSTIRFGIESGSDRILKLLKKNTTKEQIKTVFEWCKKIGILTVGYFMIGNPSETEEEIEETINFCRYLKPDMIQVAFFTPYPGSPSFDLLKNSDKLCFNKFSHYNRPEFCLSNLSKDRLLKLQKIFYLKWFLLPHVFFTYTKRKLLQLFFNFRNEFDFLIKTIRFLVGE